MLLFLADRDIVYLCFSVLIFFTLVNYILSSFSLVSDFFIFQF